MKYIKNIHSTLYILVANPGIYLKELASRTIIIGIATLFLNFTLHALSLESVTIPSTMHGLIGIVIGLLLVFRNTTAYERWWDGRKSIGLLSSEVGFLSARLGVAENKSNCSEIKTFKKSIENFLNTLRDYLKLGDDGKESTEFHILQKRCIEKSLKDLKQIKASESTITGIENSLGKMLEYSNSLERIKNTPIPLSYVLHIRISIMIYLMTLPFGLFHDLGMWSTPMVMIVYYIIAGVEIISNEIENPFAGDPNDLPVDRLFSSISATLFDSQPDEECVTH